jgi:aryl-alcohol dehydrogenase-like predicted oxidoreductase
MNYRTLGRSGIKVSEIGYGAWGIGKSMWIGAEDDESLRSLKAARDAGVNFFDTALAYGDGHSEQLISRAFGRSTEVVIASKVPPKNLIWSVAAGSSLRDAFPEEYVLASLDRTPKNLDRESVDIYQFHTWIDDWAHEPEWLETVREMKQSGKVKLIGISRYRIISRQMLSRRLKQDSSILCRSSTTSSISRRKTSCSPIARKTESASLCVCHLTKAA